MLPKSYKWKKWMTVTGTFMMFLSRHLIFTWGNQSVYVTSYVLRHQSPTDFVISPWMTSIYLVFLTLGLTVCGTLVKFAGRRPVLLCSVVVGSIGVLATYFSVQHSMEMVNVTLGIIQGFGNGLLESLMLLYVSDWVDNDEGLLLAISHCGCNAAAGLINPLTTEYLNPHQLKPEAEVRAFKFFSQDQVVDKVPGLFLILGGYGVVVNIIGFVMVRENTEPKNTTTTTTTSYSSTSSSPSGLQRSRESTMNSLPQEENNHHSLNCTTDDSYDHAADQDIPPSGMMKTKVFYVVFYAFLAGNVTALVILNYYKAYGQLHIQDDQFMAWIGTWMGVSVVLAKLIWGELVDRLGVKNGFIALLSVTSVALAFYFFTATINRWLYFATSLLISSGTTIFSFYSSALAKLFGKKHVGNNFGILAFLALGPLLAIPVSFEKLIEVFDFFGLFTFSAALNGIALVLVTIVLS